MVMNASPAHSVAGEHMYTQIPRLLVRAALVALATLSLSCSSTGRHVSDWGER